jgi:ABC-type Fe3+-hydroxamate transport system substrate-binding protein
MTPPATLHDANRRTLGLMLLILLSAALGWLSGGCAYSTFESQNVKGTSVRLLWDTSGFEATLPGSNGPVKIKLGSSGTDADALGAVAKGAAEGTAKGMTGR